MFYQIHHIGSSEYLKRESEKNFSYPVHLHQSFELIMLLSGSMEITIDNTVHKLSKGETILIFPNELHSLSSIESEHILFIFSPKLIQAFITKYANKRPRKRILKPNDYLFDSLARLNAEMSAIEMKGILYSLAALYENNNEFIENFSDKNELIMRIFDFIDKNYHEDCLLSDLAHELGYNNAYLSRYFKRITGMSYNNYVNVCRLNNASYLLSNTNHSMLEISIDCGYKSLRSFNRNFKEYFSVSPSEYKNSNN